MKLKKVSRRGYVETRRILTEQDYLATKEEFFEKYGCIMPELENLPVNLKEARVLTSRLKVTIHTDEGVHVYEFEPGFITDFASVPSMFRSFIDNDNDDLVISSLVHDANFRYHYMGFKKSNLLFKRMNRKAGASWFTSNASYWAVNSRWGRKSYGDRPRETAEFVEYDWKDR